jgi:hypothetical protein
MSSVDDFARRVLAVSSIRLFSSCQRVLPHRLLIAFATRQEGSSRSLALSNQMPLVRAPGRDSHPQGIETGRYIGATNWSVNSQSATELVTDLFRRLAADLKLSRAEALRQPMMALGDGPGFVGAGG